MMQAMPSLCCMRAADVLVLHAGVMACPQSYTKDGFEMQTGEGSFSMTIRTSCMSACAHMWALQAPTTSATLC